jgi:hypothetical protein
LQRTIAGSNPAAPTSSPLICHDAIVTFGP